LDPRRDAIAFGVDGPCSASAGVTLWTSATAGAFGRLRFNTNSEIPVVPTVTTYDRYYWVRMEDNRNRQADLFAKGQAKKYSHGAIHWAKKVAKC